MSNLNLYSVNLKSFLLVLSLHILVKSLPISFLQAPSRCWRAEQVDVALFFGALLQLDPAAISPISQK